MTPKFKHDCDGCIFLSWVPIGPEGHDLYFCPKCDGGSIIARYGDEGSQYSSAPWQIAEQIIDTSETNEGSWQVFKEALREAFARGLIVPKVLDLYRRKARKLQAAGHGYGSEVLAQVNTRINVMESNYNLDW